jgi:hypothetical protein
VGSELTDEEFWAACAHSLGAPIAHVPDGSVAVSELPLHEALAGYPREDAVRLLLAWRAPTNGAGSPSVLVQELAGTTEGDELRVLCLRLGVPAPAKAKAGKNRLQYPKNSKEDMREAIVAAVEQFAQSHPEDAQTALLSSRSASASAGPAVVLRRRFAPPLRSDSEGPSAMEEESESEAPEPPRAFPTREKLNRAAKSRGASAAAGSGSRSAVLQPSALALGALSRLRTLSPPPRARDAARSVRIQEEKTGKHKRRKHRKRSPSPSSSSSSSSNSASSSGASDSEDESGSSSSTSSSDSSWSRHARRRSSRHRRHKRRRASARVADEMEKIGMTESIAQEILANILRGRRDATVSDIISRRSFKSQRNKNEVMLLARAIDCLREGQESGALELLTRRLAGVQLADTQDSWTAAGALLGNTEANADVPDRILRRVLKTAANVTTLARNNAGGSGVSAAGRSGGRPSGAGRTGDRDRSVSRGRSGDGGGAPGGSGFGRNKKPGKGDGGGSQPRGGGKA